MAACCDAASDSTLPGECGLRFGTEVVHDDMLDAWRGVRYGWRTGWVLAEAIGCEERIDVREVLDCSRGWSLYYARPR